MRAALACCAALASCASAGHSGSPLRIDERSGSYRGIEFGAPIREVVRRFGYPGGGHSGSEVPIGVDYYDVGGPTVSSSPLGDTHTLRYHGVAFLTGQRRVYGFVTVDLRAETRFGVRIGDPQARVRERYRGAKCEIANEGTEYATFPLCTVMVSDGRYLWFGGDPVKSIWLAAQTRAGLRDP
jgi:hypothetical protein